MKRFVLLLLSGLPVFSQITLSTNAVTFTQRQSGPTPFAQTLSIGGSGNLTLGACSNLTGGFDFCANYTFHLVATTAPTTATVYLDGQQNAIGPGVPQGTWSQVVTGSSGCTGSCTVTFTLNLTAVVRPTFTSTSGSFTGCSNSNAVFYDLDTCVFQGGITPGPSPFNMWVGAGNTYTDGNFGGVIKQITHNPPVWQALFADSINQAVNLDNTLVLTSGQGGDLHVLSLANGSEIYPNMQADTGGITYAWSSLTPKLLFYLKGMQVRKYVLDTRVDSLVYAFVGGGTSTGISNGNDNPTSKDDWWCFQPNGSGDNFTVLINLNNGQTYNSPTWPSSPAPSGNGLTYSPRSCENTVGINTPDGNRYFMQNFNGTWSYFEKYHLTGGGTVVDDGVVGPANQHAGYDGYANTCTAGQLAANDCFDPGHLSWVEVAGVQYLVFHSDNNPPYLDYLFFARFDNPLMTTSVEAGGGLYAVFPFGGGSDSHTSCAKFAPICTTGTDTEFSPLAAWNLTTMSGSGSSPITATTDVNYSGANGDSVLVGGVYCNDGSSHAANGVQTVTGLSGANIGFLGTTSSCTRSLVIPGTLNNSGSFVQNVAPAQTYAHQEELWTTDATNIASRQFAIKRIAKTRAIAIGDWLTDSYYGESHPAISADGTLVAFESNNGTPSVMGVFTVPVTAGPAPGGKRRIITVH